MVTPSISDQWLRAILAVLYQRRTATRYEIAQATGLNPASISQALQYLAKAGVIQKEGELHSNVGRKRELLKLNSEAGCFAVADLEGSLLRFALTNFLGDVRFRWEERVSAGKRLDIRTVVHGIRTVLDQLEGSEKSRVLAIGVSYTGMMDRSGCVTAVNLGWSDFPLGERLRENFSLPIFFGRDGYCKVLAERWLGVAQGYNNCLYVLVGVGVGVGSFVDGHLVKGRDGMAGEFGHITIDPAAPDRCNCGKTGCLEAIVSSPNIVRQYVELSGLSAEEASQVRLRDVFARARDKNQAALSVIKRAGDYLGLALSHLVNVLNPELIVLGGDLVQGQDLLIPHIRAELSRHVLPKLCESLSVKASSLGFDTGLKGAASLAFHDCLDDSALLRRICTNVTVRRRAANLFAEKVAG